MTVPGQSIAVRRKVTVPRPPDEAFTLFGSDAPAAFPRLDSDRAWTLILEACAGIAG